MTCEVVVTGMGALTPLGPSCDASWDAAIDGQSGASRITRFDPTATNLRSQIACETPFDAADHDSIDRRRMGRYAQYAVVAANQALADAGLDSASETWPANRVGTSIGTGFGGFPEIESTVGGRPSTTFVPSTLPNLAAGHVSMHVDARGPMRAPATACAASTQALGTAADVIRAGRADVMIAGGTEACISPLAVRGFDVMRALSTRNDEPEAASRPFDAARDGFVIGDGAGILILEARDHAAERGATPYAVLSGYSETADAHHVTRPPDDAHGMIRCLQQALTHADFSPAVIDHINAHATGTPHGDAHEAAALTSVFDTCPPVTSTKSLVGHTLGAAGAIESIFTVQALRDQVIPPTINYESPDPECDLPVVTKPRKESISAALTASAGFGGVNGALLFETP